MKEKVILLVDADAGTWCLDPREGLGPGQAEEIDRVYRAYPHLHDDEFVARHREGWLGAGGSAPAR